MQTTCGMEHRLAKLVFALVWLCLFLRPLPGLAESITVRVVDADGKPVKAAEVLVLDADGKGQRVFTDAQGQATATVPGGREYRIVVDSPAQQPFTNQDGTTGTRETFKRTIGTVSVAPGGDTSAQFNTSHSLFSSELLDPTTPGKLAEDANSAAEICDRTTYERATGQLKSFEAVSQFTLRGSQAQFERFRKQHGMGDISTPGRLRQAIGLAQGAVKSGVADAEGERRAAEWPQLFERFESLFRALNEARQAHEAAQRAKAQVKELKVSCVPRADDGLFYASVGAGPGYLHRPDGKFFRTEVGGVLGFPALRFNTDKTIVNIEGTVGARFRTSVFGTTREVAVQLRGWHFDSRAGGRMEVFTPPAGGVTGLFSPTAAFAPFGGYFTGSPLSNVRYRSDFEDFGGVLSLAVAFDTGPVTLSPFAGLRLARTNVNDSLNLVIGNPAFTTFEQRSDISSTAIGPVAGASVRGELGDGFYAFGEASVGLAFARARGDWQTFVPLVDPAPRSQRLSRSKTAFQFDAATGVGYRLPGLAVELVGRLSHGTGSPHLEFATPEGTADGTGGARIGFGKQTSYGLSVRGIVTF